MVGYAHDATQRLVILDDLIDTGGTIIRINDSLQCLTNAGIVFSVIALLMYDDQWGFNPRSFDLADLDRTRPVAVYQRGRDLVPEKALCTELCVPT